MHEVLRRAWIPTLLFAVPTLVLELLGGGVSWPPIGTFTVFALIVVPLTWWMTRATRTPVDRGRWAASGALSATLILVVPISCRFAYCAIKARGTKLPPDGMGDLMTLATVLALGIEWAILTPVGAAIGAFAAFLYGRTARASESSEAWPLDQR